jgi:outer membrane biosynthesis protein TonB
VILTRPPIPPVIEVIMKRFIIFLAVVVVVLALTSPVLAASLGISPSHVELEVPGDGSTTADLKAYYFSGDIKVSLVDIPLRIEPEIINVDALDEPEDIRVTIYGDDSLGSQVYNGYIKFLGMSGEMIAIAVQVRAQVTNIVEGQLVPEEAPAPEVVPEETPAPEAAPEEPSSPEAAPEEPSSPEAVPEVMPTESSPSPTPSEPQATEQKDVVDDLSLNLVILIAGGLVFLGLIALSVSLAVRRRY